MAVCHRDGAMTNYAILRRKMELQWICRSSWQERAAFGRDAMRVKLPGSLS
jgi:hypothetical protein